MNFKFLVEVDVERQEGKFASRDEIGDLLREALTEADPGTVEGENGGVYETSNWDVQDG